MDRIEKSGIVLGSEKKEKRGSDGVCSNGYGCYRKIELRKRLRGRW